MLNRIICGFRGHKSRRIAIVEGYEIFECSRCGELIAVENLSLIFDWTLNNMAAAPYLKDRIRRSLGLENNGRD